METSERRHVEHPPEPVVVYSPHHRRRVGLVASWVSMVQNVLASRDLIVQLFKRDFLAVYKKSFLGVAWVVLVPALAVVPLVFMHSAKVLRPGVLDVPYPVFALLSITVWQLFSGTVTLSSQALRGASSFILQVSFPHEALVVKQCAQQVANSILGFAFVGLVLLAFGVTPHWQSIFVPLMAIPLLLLGAGIGLLLSVVSILTADLERGLGYALQLLLFVTPVAYTADIDSPVLRQWIAVNPLTYLVGDVRDVVLYGRIAHLDRYLISCAAAVGVFLLSWRLFYLSEQQVIEKLN